MDIQGLLSDQLANLLICPHENIIGLLYYSFQVVCSYLKEGFLRGDFHFTHIVLHYQGFILFLRCDRTLSIIPEIREITVILANLAFPLSNVFGHKETWRTIWILWAR